MGKEIEVPAMRTAEEIQAEYNDVGSTALNKLYEFKRAEVELNRLVARVSELHAEMAKLKEATDASSTETK